MGSYLWVLWAIFWLYYCEGIAGRRGVADGQESFQVPLWCGLR
jgi:hypothetical protein